jgi:acetylornithine deacetylase/succinyl-diaminopimelate desuccinylase-like protein
VAFETGAASVDEFEGIKYPGEGFGSKWLVDRGVTADYALIGETSEFGIVTSECGYVQLKIRIKGRNVYTPRLERGSLWQENPNAFAKAAHVVLALEDWAIKYEQRECLETSGGVIIPKSQIISMRGGRWGDVDSSSCSIYLDVWLAPGANPRAIKKEIEDLIRKLKVECEITVYQWGRGYIAKNAGPMINAIKVAHRYVLGSEPVIPPSPVLSMWRDMNVFNEVGIPSVCYGAARQKEPFTDSQNRAMKISDLVAATKVYALVAISLCG